MKNKRKNERTNKRIKSVVHSLEGITFSPSENLSNGGIFILTPEPMMEGSEVELSLYISNKDDPIKMKGIVRWVRDDKNKEEKAGMGIEFTNSLLDKI